MTLSGYLDRLSAPAGSSVTCMISTSSSNVLVDVQRLIHGDDNPCGPGFKSRDVVGITPRTIQGRLQQVFPGSCMRADLTNPITTDQLKLRVLTQPTRARGGLEQGVISLLDTTGQPALSVVIRSDGRLAILRATDELPLCSTAVRWRTQTWYYVELELRPGKAPTLRCGELGKEVAAEWIGECEPITGVVIQTVVIGAIRCPKVDGQWRPERCFNGKIEQPTVFTGGEAGDWDVTCEWHFERDIDLSVATDEGPQQAHGLLINAPMRGVTGHSWTGRRLDFTTAPEQYAAIHFHDDDLEDAGWRPDAVLDLPIDLPSGVYAVRMRTEQDIDWIPFAVTPAQKSSARTVLLLPTFTYVAYANERMLDRLDFESDQLVDHPVYPGALDEELARHPEWGLSLYDLHSDGSGCCYSSHLRPIPNLRPTYRMWLQNAPRHLAADLYLIDWLTHQSIEFDVITDHDLHAQGVDLLARRFHWIPVLAVVA